jgi:cAMP phosphodiesterase
MKKTSIILDEMIHIMLGCTMHLHGHGNKMVPFIKPSILMHLIMALSFVVAFVGQLMTLTAIVSHVKSVTTTSTTKTS